MGMYKKYSEADLYEVMRLQNLLRDKKAIRAIEPDSLYASFNDITIFHIFFKEIKVLKRILLQLD